MSRRSIPVTHRIRSLLALTPSAKPKFIVEKLGKQGHKATCQQVSSIKHNIKKMKGNGKKRLETALSNATPSTNGVSQIFSALELRRIFALRRQIEEMGIEQAQEVFNSLSE